MSVSENIAGILRDENVTFGVSVPCILLSEFLSIISREPDFTHVPVTREEEGIGVCAGAYLAGRTPFMAMQNSGLGNSINALCSLSLLYEMPLLMLMSHRGTPGERINAQKPMGLAVPGLLETIGIEYSVLDEPKDAGKLHRLIERARSKPGPVAALLPFSFWEGNP